MKKLLLLISTCGLCLLAWAQPNVIFMATDRNSIGINSYPLFSRLLNSNGSVPFEIFYKRQVEYKNCAWRVGLLVNYDYEDYNRFDGAIDDPPYSVAWSKLMYDKIQTTSYTIGGYIGYEWQRVIGKCWLLAGGSDLRYTYNHAEGVGEMENLYYIKGIVPPYESGYAHAYNYNYPKDDAHTLSIHPFVEINFAINTYLAVNVGFSLSFSYSFLSAASTSSG